MEFTPKLKKHLVALYRREQQEDPLRSDFFEEHRSCPVMGFDLHQELFYAVQCGHDPDGRVTVWEADDPQPIALCGLDFDRCRIGTDAVQHAEASGEPLYRDFLRVPDERAKACYGGVSDQPSYETLMGLFFRSMFFDHLGTGQIALVSLPEGPEWDGQEAVFAAFLNRQCLLLDHWHAELDRSRGRAPDPLQHTAALVVPRQQALAFEHFTRAADEPSDAFAAARGLAQAGYLLWYKEILLLHADEALRQARPHADERLRDTLCDQLGRMLTDRLELRLKSWAESSYAARRAQDVLWGKSCGVRTREAQELMDPVQELLLNRLPTTGRSPEEDPGAYAGGFPPLYRGPRTVYGSENLLHALTDLVNDRFCSRLFPWTKGQYYAEDRDWVQTEPELMQQLAQPFYTAVRLSPPSSTELFGTLNAMTHSAALNLKSAPQANRKALYELFLSRREKICRLLSLSIYHNTAAWNAMADRLFAQMAANLQCDLDKRLEFLGHTAPTPHHEEGLLE